MVPRAALLLYLFVALSVARACQTSEDCLLLGSCQAGVCRCRQGFTGPECGQLDLAPASTSLGYRNDTASTWGGLPISVGGRWHMYVSMIKGQCPLGTFNNNSFIAHLSSTAGADWQGPYEYAGTVVEAFAHNAAPRVLPDGSVAVWFIGYDGEIETIRCPGGKPPPNDVWPDWTGKQIAMAHAPAGHPGGPWKIEWLFKQPQLPNNWWQWDCSATNPSATVADDGSVRMMYRGTMCTHCSGCPSQPGNTSERLGIATAPTIKGPYTRPSTALNLGNQSIEDPYYWRGAEGTHHLIGHSGTACRHFSGGSNWCGVVASSSDGERWKLASAPAYGPNVTVANGTVLKLFARQRPQLLFDPSGSKGKTPRKLLAVVNGAQTLLGGTGGLMQRDSFTLIQPVHA